MKSTVALVVCLGLVFALAISASAAVWDLATDFASVNNLDPNGVWHFGSTNHHPYTGDAPNAFTQLFTQQVSSYLSGELGSSPGWMDPNQYWVGICQSAGNAAPFDFPQGKVGGHTPGGLSWTAPRDTVVNISGDAWMIRIPPLGRDNGVTLAVDGSSSLLMNDVQIPGQFGTNSANPMTFAFNNISIKQGQSIWLALDYISARDYVGYDFKVSEVPEPASLCALASGLVGLVGFAIRRRR